MNSLQKLVAFSLLSMATFACAVEPNSFDLMAGGKKTAATTYTLEKMKDGIKAHSSIDYVNGGVGNAVTVDYRLSADGLFQTGSIARPRYKTVTSYKSNAAQGYFDVGVLLANKTKGYHLPVAKPDALVAFPDDPGSWQVLLDTTSAHPHPDGIYYLMVIAMDAGNGNRLEPFRLHPPTETTGELDGKTVTLKHFKLDFNNGAAHLYADADGRLMQAETPFGVNHVRTNFTLTK